MRIFLAWMLSCGWVYAQTADAWFKRGLSLGEERNFRDAIASFSRAIQMNPNFERAYYYRAQAYGFTGAYEQAIADYDRALGFRPNYFAYLAGRTEANRDRGMLGLAIREADRLIANHYRDEQRNPLLFVLRGTVFWKMGLAREAEQEFDFGRTMAYQLRNSLDRAREQVDAYIQNFKAKGPAGTRAAAPAYANPFETGLNASDKGDDRAAVAYFDQALARNANHAEAWFFRGRSYFRLFQYARAVDDLERAAQLNPRLAGAWRYLGLSYFGLWKDAESIRAYGQALKIDPKSEVTYLNRAQTYLAMKPPMRREAVSDFTASLKLNPENAKALNGRAVMLHALGNAQGAIADLKEAMRVAPKAARAYCNMGVVLGDMGRRDEEQQWYQRCWSMDPSERAWYEGQKKWADAYEQYHREQAQLLASIGGSSSSSGGSSCGGAGGQMHACEAGDRLAEERFRSGTATQDDKNRYSGGW